MTWYVNRYLTVSKCYTSAETWCSIDTSTFCLVVNLHTCMHTGTHCTYQVNSTPPAQARFPWQQFLVVASQDWLCPQGESWGRRRSAPSLPVDGSCIQEFKFTALTYMYTAYSTIWHMYDQCGRHQLANRASLKFRSLLLIQVHVHVDVSIRSAALHWQTHS